MKGQILTTMYIGGIALLGLTLHAERPVRDYFAPDSIIATGEFFMPSDDGRGLIDSVTVILIGPPPLAPRILYSPAPDWGTRTEYQFRVAAPLPGVGYKYYAQVTTFRRLVTAYYYTVKDTVTIADSVPAVTGGAFSVILQP